VHQSDVITTCTEDGFDVKAGTCEVVVNSRRLFTNIVLNQNVALVSYFVLFYMGVKLGR
jgi:hypothetical protein